MLLPFANEKIQTKTNMNKENYSTELCPSLYYNLSFPFYHFFPLPNQSLKVVDGLNLALSFYDIARRQNANPRISLVPGKLLYISERV